MTSATHASALTPSAAPGRDRAIDLRVVGTAAILILAGAIYLNEAFDWRQAALFLVGGAAGVILYHADFGFTSAWRVCISDGRGAGLRAQMIILAVTCMLFFPALAASSPLLGQTVRGALAPLGISVIVGAFMFGVGMQLGGG